MEDKQYRKDNFYYQDEFAPCPACKSGWKIFTGTNDGRIFHCGSVFHPLSNILEQSDKCKYLRDIQDHSIGLAIIPKVE